MARSALVFVLLLSLVGILFAGWHVWTRLEHGRTLWHRIVWLPLALVLLVAGFVVVVELRCTLGWISKDECHVWGQ